MNIFTRRQANEIEGINEKQLRRILEGEQIDGSPAIDSIVFDTILLTDQTKIKCIKNYYATATGTVPKPGRANNACTAVQKFYRIQCRPYDCRTCHNMMMRMKLNGQIKRR